MATYTSNYGLHQWEPEDNFLRTDFNEDLKKIDEALVQKAEEVTVDALENQVEKKAEFVTGSYKGNGEGQSISLGFQPQAVYIASTTYTTFATEISNHPLLRIRSDGFSVSHSSNYGATPNRSDGTYSYLALK